MTLSLYDKIVLLDGAMAYWPLDGNAGDFALCDASGKNHGGRIVSNLLPWFGPGSDPSGAPCGVTMQNTGPIAGSAQGSVRLNGNSWIEVRNVDLGPLPYKSGPQGAFSFEVWINVEDRLAGDWSSNGGWPPYTEVEMINIWTPDFNNSIFQFDTGLYSPISTFGPYPAIFNRQYAFTNWMYLNDAFSLAGAEWSRQDGTQTGFGLPPVFDPPTGIVAWFGRWLHYVAAYDGHVAQLYLNGAPLATFLDYWDYGAPFLFTESAGQAPFNCRLGAGYGGSWQYPYQGNGPELFNSVAASAPGGILTGSLACVAMYPVCLSATQVAEHYTLATTGLHAAGYTAPQTQKRLGYASSLAGTSGQVSFPALGGTMPIDRDPSSSSPPELRAVVDEASPGVCWEHDDTLFRAQTRDGFTVLET